MTYLHDLRQAFRSLARRPGFSLMVILTLGVGIGANATIFTFLREFAFPTLGAPDEHRLFNLNTYTPKTTWGASSYPDLLDYRAAIGDDGEIHAWRMFGATIKLDVKDEGNLFAWGEAVEPGHFALFGDRVRLGRAFLEADTTPVAEKTIVLHDRFWRRHFGADPEVLGRRLVVNGHGYTIVGVTSKGFQSHGMTHQLYLPLSHLEDVLPGEHDDRQKAGISAMLKLRPGLAREWAEAKLMAVAGGLDETLPLAAGERRLELRPVREGGDYYRTELRLLLTTAGMLLLLASANVANLMLARATERRREMAVHAAIGAGRGRLMRRLLSESLMLSLLGGAVGLAVADPLSRILEKYFIGGPVGTGPWAEGSRIFVVDHEITLFTALLSMVVGVIFGAAPVLYTWRLDLVQALKGESATAGRARRFGIRQVLVTTQVMLSVVLLLGAGLLVRSLLEAWRQEPGFDTDRLFLATLYVAPRPAAEDPKQRWLNLYDQAVERLAALPGVDSVTLASQAPLGGIRRSSVADSARPEDEHMFGFLAIGADFFETLGVTLERGRTLDHRDRGANSDATVVNRKLANTLWPGEDPLGRTVLIRQGEKRAATVVGVVSDFRLKNVLEEPQPQIYTPISGQPRLTLILRMSGTSLTGADDSLRQTLAGFHQDVSLVDLAPLQAQINYSMQERRMVTDTALLFGILGLLLAATGIFSVMSLTVTSRTHEIGIRMAVGAAARDIHRMVLGQTLRLVLSGTAVGIAIAFGLSRFLRSLLFGVETLDPLTFAAIPLLLALTAVAAALVPATRAARVEPTAALRQI